MTDKQKKEIEKQEAINFLKKQLKIKAGSTVYTICEHVSSSGMTRHIKLLYATKGGIVNISWYAAKITGWRMAKNSDCVIVGGCGMDMGFNAVYTLSRYLFPKGYIRNKNTLSNAGDTGTKDIDGGYAINQQWI